MRPNFNHNPGFKEPLQPAANDRVDNMATRAVLRQQSRLEQQIGHLERARIPSEEGAPSEPLYGYEITLHDDTEIKLAIDVDPITGEAREQDRDFVEARNRYAVLRSRERSRGSRRFNFGFAKQRGEDAEGYSYELDEAEGHYQTALEDFVARKMKQSGQLENGERAKEALAAISVQEMSQMSALERMAAEQKSGNRFMNFLRKHKNARTALGIALAGGGTAALLLGQAEIALPLFAARTAVSTTGGYMLGRTAWDALQGRRARKKSNDDPRMTRVGRDDLSLDAEDAFKKLIKLNGAEARAGSSKPKRQRLARSIGQGLVQGYFIDNINLSDNPEENAIKEQVRSLRGMIAPLEVERLASDQTQSRKRHIAGLTGALVFGAMPMFKTVGMGISELHIGGGGSGGSEAAVHTHSGGGHGGNHDHAGANHNQNGVDHNQNGGNQHGGVTESHPAAADHQTAKPHEAAHPHHPDSAQAHDAHDAQDSKTQAHAHHGDHTRGNKEHLAHETVDGITTNELHVKTGGGFISTLQEQYGLSPQQAEATYYAMHEHLAGAPGTYMVGSDVRISSPGDFKLPEGARAILEERLKALHEMAHPAHVVADAKTGGIVAPDHTAAGTKAPAPGAAYIQAAQLAHHHDMPLPRVGDLGPQEMVQLRSEIEHFVQHDGLTKLGVTIGKDAQHALIDYVQRGHEHPVDPASARRALHMLDHIRLAYGHSLHNVATDVKEAVQSAADEASSVKVR